MTTTEVLVGVACGIGAGILVGIIYWAVFIRSKKKPKNIKQTKHHKTYDQAKQNLIIKPDSIPAFDIPCYPLHVQEPVLPSSASSDILLERQKSPIPKDIRQGRRGSVPLDQLITQSAQVGRKISPTPKSPPSIYAINNQAIENLENIQKKRGKRIAAIHRSSTSPLGKLEFSLYYDQDFGNLQIHIIRGSQVYQTESSEDLMELVVSVAVVFDGKQIWHDKTHPTEATTNPEFNEQLTIHGLTSNQMRVGTLKLTIKNNITDSPISVAYYPLSTVPYNFLTTETVRLNEVEDIDEAKLFQWRQDDDELNNGELLVSMLHSPADKKLTIGVECARDLPSGNRGPPDSFVKVDILLLGHKLHSKKTNVIPKSCHPEYNAVFEFAIEDDKLPQVMVSMKVKSHGKMRSTRKIGMIKLGYTADPNEPQYRHWEQVLHHPYLNIEKWHAIGKHH
ncbi:synaptotagmin-1-like [Actinia tenebrosa]|uniref:Synaptotagmin-1-like n=1 Tax=Actinia tenebrosa TaxID=6105 RepID=A0A6P8IB84_ACTTE|nr:synaptotagmin-1-like [Actinia tenebrosa]